MLRYVREAARQNSPGTAASSALGSSRPYPTVLNKSAVRNPQRVESPVMLPPL